MHTYFINLPKVLVAEVLHRILPVTSDGLGLAGRSIPVGCSVQLFPGVSSSIFISILSPSTHVSSATAGVGMSQEETKLKTPGPVTFHHLSAFCTEWSECT